MREFKFRGFGIDLKKWIYGNLVIDDDPTHIDHSVRIVSYKGTVRVDPASVGQYIGKSDRDGTPIYEGDIIEVCNGSINRNPIIIQATVTWNEFAGTYNVPMWSPFIDETHWYRVVGNTTEGKFPESQKTYTVAEVVRNKIHNDMTVSDALRRGILSSSNYARQIRDDVEKMVGKKVSAEAIIMAIRRMGKG